MGHVKRDSVYKSRIKQFIPKRTAQNNNGLMKGIRELWKKKRTWN